MGRSTGGRGGTLLVEGEPGIGKTRLVDAFLQDAARDDVHVLYGSYDPAGRHGGLAGAILARFGMAELEEALEPYFARSPDLTSIFAALVRSRGAAAPQPAPAAEELVCHLLVELATEKPVLWIVEDIRFARAESRAIVLEMARTVEGRRALLLLTSPPGLPTQELDALQRLETFRHLRLSRLKPEDVERMLADAFGSEEPRGEFAKKITASCDGVPLFVFETLRGLVKRKFIVERPDGTFTIGRAVDEIEIPSAVRDLIEVRLKDLSDEERSLLDAGAVEGLEFDPDFLASVCDLSRVEVLGHLAAIERRLGLVRASGPWYRFDHHQIQEVIHRALSPALRGEYETLLRQARGSGRGGTLTPG